MNAAQVQSIIDATYAQATPEWRERWIAACERQLRGEIASVPVPADARERTWSLLEGALQNSEPAELEAAMGNALSAIAGSTGADILSGPTVRTPCQDSATKHGAVLAAVGAGR